MRNDIDLKIMDHLLEIHETIAAEFIPAKVQHHFRTSRKEALLGMRSVLDYAIEKLDDIDKREVKKSDASRSIIISD
ncbi:hypothetical protein [Bacillus sp. 03113]|uniref:hypothetical protein n=1 Tax=Bacillus sp. 03113 TaxID=2578211 RepID=UPI001143C28D|nr:hypothetical protein [Bacillus sp. 03113]